MFSLSRFGLSTFSLSRYGLSRFGHSRFGHGFGENTECPEDVGDGLLQHIGDNKVFHYHPGGGKHMNLGRHVLNRLWCLSYVCLRPNSFLVMGMYVLTKQYSECPGSSLLKAILEILYLAFNLMV